MGCVALTEVSQQKLRRLFSGSQQIKLSRYGQSITEWMLILPFAYHVYQFDACQQRLRSSERVESLHRTCPSFDITVILFQNSSPPAAGAKTLSERRFFQLL
jgi:hypothetical protein